MSVQASPQKPASFLMSVKWVPTFETKHMNWGDSPTFRPGTRASGASTSSSGNWSNLLPSEGVVGRNSGAGVTCQAPEW